MPKLVQTIIDANKKIPQDDSIVNINSMQKSQEDAPKKIDSRKDVEDSVQSQEFKNWFGDWQNDSENASKVVNALNPAVLPCPALPIKKQKWDIPGLKINKDLMN